MIGNLFTLKQLEALIWVADLGSFRRAAAHLNTTQPNISARIAGLETTLGVTLMQRDAGSIRLTEKGTALLAQARQVLREAEGLVTIAERPDLIDDSIRLGVTEVVASTWLRPFLRALAEAYPNLTVELTVDLSRDLDQELAANALDLTLQTAPFSTPASGQLDLATYDYVWVAAPDLAAQIGPAPDLAALVRHPVLGHARHTQAHLDLIHHFDGTTAPKARLVPSSSLSAAMNMVLDGMGVAVMPRVMVAGALTEGTLKILPAPWHPQPLQVAARYHAERTPGHVTRAAELARDCAMSFAHDHKNLSRQ
ncbi:LysR family transcriptional regulator [Sulfitobacter delicatus]|uniref:DNA-binding transcriptional regulator, LysR family n=1 Tax=Sulfitobacter delicatus TaxID=218672 RepID=A0A1G7J5J2_9RHOB|nr:LysR family transcriptional regulator [Sulfitobacter delicatus]SDF20128.1 DNA-binding transcriptional regulator, LysR family [Sulfitobacter delicatus]